jgi:hypothetical protein
MGKSWKEKPGKYRHNADFQKKQNKKNDHHFQSFPPIKDEDGFESAPNMDVDIPDFREDR